MNNADLKDMIDAKLKFIIDKIDANHAFQTEISQNILSQATKTNGRVNDHDKRLNLIEVGESKHVINCPRIADIEKVNTQIQTMRNENELWRLAMKYPRVAIGIIVFSVIVTVSVVGYSILEMHSIIADFKTEQKK